jgi:hypothetical protein
MSTVGNGTADTSGTGPASRYNLKLSCLFVVFVLFLYRLSANTNNLYAVIILLILNNNIIFLLNFKIKIYRKMRKFLTLPPSTKHSLTLDILFDRCLILFFVNIVYFVITYFIIIDILIISNLF